MIIRVLFFGALREALDTAAETVTLSANTATVGDVADILRARGGVWERELDRGKALAFAVRQDFAAADSPVRDGDEVAIFPPVTGG